MPSNKYFTTNYALHEDILGQFEDSVNADSSLTQQQKDDLNTLLYSKFHHEDSMQLQRVQIPKSLKTK